MSIEDDMIARRDTARAAGEQVVPDSYLGVTKWRVRELLAVIDQSDDNKVDVVYSLLCDEPSWYTKAAREGLRFCDGVVIPTFTDERSLQATIESYNLIKNDAKSIVIVINNYTQEKKYLYACEVLNESLGNPVILDVRTTTLFERVAKDGAEWFKNINNGKGEFQLARTRESHQLLYNEINHLIGYKHD